MTSPPVTAVMVVGIMVERMTPCVVPNALARIASVPHVQRQPLADAQAARVQPVPRHDVVGPDVPVMCDRTQGVAVMDAVGDAPHPGHHRNE